MAEFVRVAGKADVQPGQGKVVEVNEKMLAVFNVDGTFHVLDNECPHRGGSLCEGDLEGCTITCPWHRWEYNLASGDCVNEPETKKATVYQVKVEGDDIKVML